ncbi:hypothetical protein [Streptomyces sp. NPDC013455]|uniref:hypothetical protein n=1 Tax=Streptomyces sp. NPDC013455 TaxID=3155605 RepID=UPI00340451A1
MGTGRAIRLVRTARGAAVGRAVEPVAAEIVRDRTALLDIMRDLDVPFAATRCARAGRAKSRDGEVTWYAAYRWAPYSISKPCGKGGHGCQTLRRLSATGERLDRSQLDTLLDRARPGGHR